MSFNQQTTVPAHTIQKMYAQLTKQYKDLEDKHEKRYEAMKDMSETHAKVMIDMRETHAKEMKAMREKHAKEMENMRKHSNHNAIISYNREKENKALEEENRIMSDKIEHLKEETLGLKEENQELTKKNQELTKKNQELTPNVIEMAMKEMDDAMEKRDKRDMENKIHRLTEENRTMSDKIEHLKKRVLEVSSIRDILVGVSQTLRSVIKRQNKELKMWNKYYYNTTHYEPDVPDESEWTHCQTWEEEEQEEQ
jgi:chromosome segregation ATPase